MAPKDRPVDDLVGPRLSGAEAQLSWLRPVYYALDGRWYLKVRDRFGAEVAQSVNEEVTRSLARAQVRVWCELVGLEGIDDCRTLGQFLLDVFDVLYGSWSDAVRVIRSEPDVWEMQHIKCTIFEMGVAAGYEEGATPGLLPGCGGIRAMAEGWAAAAGDFHVEQLPAAGPPHGVACRYRFSRGKFPTCG